jgi:hypothetical protein
MKILFWQSVAMINAVFSLSCPKAIGVWLGNLYVAGQTYYFKFEASIRGNDQKILGILKNHNEIRKINKDVVRSEAFARNRGNKLERMICRKRCLLGYCFRLLFHEQIHESAFGVTAKIVSRKSSFYGGETTWNVRQLADDRSEISIHGFPTTNFWIPPFLGEMILRRVFLSEMKETTSRIEQLSGTKPKKMKTDESTISALVIPWQEVYGRHNLPWQVEPTPYRVWISEIMLQQTQVGTVKSYFISFLTSFPDLQTLAKSDLDIVLRLRESA